MQVSVEKTSELSRKLTVSVPETVLQEKINARLVSLSREIKLHGFRPGKIPVQVVRKMHGAKIQEEVTNEFLNTSCQEALKNHNLIPVNTPHIQFVEEAGVCKYTAEFEVYAEIHLELLSDLEIVRPVASVTETDIDHFIENLRTQKIHWNTVTHPAETGDRLTLSFSGFCDGNNFTNGRIDGFAVVIGSKQMIPGFEEHLLGLEIGANKIFDLTFPSHYKEPHLAGKTASYSVNVIKIEAPILPEINAEFIKAYGIKEGSLELFRGSIKNALQKNMEQVLHNTLRDNVITAVHEKIQIAVPSTLVDMEIDALQKRYTESKAGNAENFVLPSRESFQKLARQRTALSLIFEVIAYKNDLHLTDDKIRSAVESLANNYENPEQIVAWYYADEKRLRDVQQMIFENMVIDWIVAQAQVSEVTLDFATAIKG